MRIALLTHIYPPASQEGIPRQRQMLARACVRLGHSVHVITLDSSPESHSVVDGVHVHRVCVPPERYEEVGNNRQMLESAVLYRALMQVHRQTPIDVVDAPIWSAPGWATIERSSIPVVLNLQTTTAQICAINGYSTPDMDRLMLLEKQCCQRAAGILADSRVALEATQSDYGIPRATPTACIYHGIPDHSSPPPVRQRRADGRVEAVMIGRLEKRKGTPQLLQALPRILREAPNLHVRFIGGDNSAHDGWEHKTGHTYSNYFHAHHPEFSDRVHFEGYVPEERLLEARREADMALVPSLYESFGFTYVEAMRDALPVVAFANDAAKELFARSEDDGACLASLGNAEELADVIIRLALNADLRLKLGQAGRRRFLDAFQDVHMATRSSAFYADVVQRARHNRNQAKPETVHQVMEALETGDGVSHIALDMSRKLAELQQPAPIHARWFAPEVGDHVAPYDDVLDGRTVGLIFHYWNYNHSIWMLDQVPGPKALYYHNITPPAFFPPGHPAERNSTRGYEQIHTAVNQFDLLISDSRYNLSTLQPHLQTKRPMLTIYPVVDAHDMQAAPYDTERHQQLTDGDPVHWLFVGRISRNKRQDNLMHWFNYACAQSDRVMHLWLVGNDRQDPDYRAELERLRRALPFGHRIHFTGKISEAELMAYYRAAHLFVCASEHEGFCIPIAHAMAMGIPVAARALTAVPETMGNTGFLIHDDNPSVFCDTLIAMATDPAVRDPMIQAQYKNIERFSKQATDTALHAVIEFLLHQTPSPLFLSSH